MIRLFTASALALILSGCTTISVPTRQPAEPVALQVMSAAVPFQPAEGAIEEDTPEDLRILMSGAIRFISWVPARVAENEREAQIRWGNHLEMAAIKALPEGYVTQPFEWTNRSVTGEDSSYRVLRVSGPLCSEFSCILEGAFVSTEDSDISQVGLMQRVATPDVAGHEDAESYTQTGVTWLSLRRTTSEFLEVGRGQGRWYRINTTAVPEFDHNAFYQRLSAALQPWNYIYAAPENPVYRTGSPVVLNQGKELHFAQPGS